MPGRHNRCNWKDEEGNRCHKRRTDALTCCLSHRCQGSRRCRARARNDRTLCRYHQRLKNQRAVRSLVPLGALIEYREPPPLSGEPAPLATFEEMARRWNRAGKARIEERKRLETPGALKKPPGSALICAWHDDAGVRCSREAKHPRNCCEKHRCRADPACRLRARNGATLCRGHRKTAGSLTAPKQNIAPWERDAEVLPELPLPLEPDDWDDDPLG